MVKTSNVALMVLIGFVVGFILGALVIRKYRPCVNLPLEVKTVQRDTVIVRDTVKTKVPPAKTYETIRVDTVRLELQPGKDTAVPIDTVHADTTLKVNDTPRAGQNGDVLIPISRKVYQTPDYRAVISGWRPSLDSMQLYRSTKTITNTVTNIVRPHWVLAAGGGVGYTTDKKVVPFVGVSLGFVIWSK